MDANYAMPFCTMSRFYRERFWLESHIAWPDIPRPRGTLFVAIEIQNANYAAGMAGIAAGSGVDLNVIAALNVRYGFSSRIQRHSWG